MIREFGLQIVGANRRLGRQAAGVMAETGGACRSLRGAGSAIAPQGGIARPSARRAAATGAAGHET